MSKLPEGDFVNMIVLALLTRLLDVGQMSNVTTWENNEEEHPLQSAWSFWYDKKQSKRAGSK